MAKKTSKTTVYSALEVANICGVVNQTAINWIRSGHLKAFLIPGGQYRVYKEDLLKFMEERNMRLPVDSEKNPFSVLIVDDDKGLNNILSKYLEKNYENALIYQAFDGFEAGIMISEHKPHLVFLDLNLPGVDGFSLCEKINSTESFGNPIVFVITSLQDEGIEERVKNLGAKEFFQKPIDFAKISEAIKNHL
jgi:excisionase family DNA binding protein